MLSRRTLLISAGLLVAGRARAADFAQALGAAYGVPMSLETAQVAVLTEIGGLMIRAARLLRFEGLEGDVATNLRTLAADPRWLYADDDVGRNRAVADMNASLAGLRGRLRTAFGDLPIPPAEVRRPAPANEARGGYREPPVYYVDLRNIRARPAWTLPTVAFHETSPGHALQATVTGGPPQPGAFSEAWATYAEQLARDLGAYAGDRRGELGYIQWRLFRMARVLADIGQGAQGWSLDEAVAAIRKIQGFDAAFVTIEADAARMRAQPGVYAAQGLGALAIGRARPGPSAKWPAFHRAILADARPAFAMLAQGTGVPGR